MDATALSQLMMFDAREAEAADAPPTSARPVAVPLRLFVTDPDVVAELLQHKNLESRHRFALEALRIGVLSLRMVNGQVDAAAVKEAGNDLMAQVRELLSTRSTELLSQLKGALTQYFDPQCGVVPQRLQSLIAKDGDLERVLQAQISPDDSQLARTLAQHFGKDSPLLKRLSPDDATGLAAQLSDSVEQALTEQRTQVLKEFSLDNPGSALSRLVHEIGERQQALGTDLKGQVDLVVGEFSLDKPHSALSRLVTKVEAAHKSISEQFSADNEASALNRLSRMLEDTSAQIDRNLTLDDESSALFRLKRELSSTLELLNKRNTEFQAEVREALAALKSRRESAKQSTIHGLGFEERLGTYLQQESQRCGDILEPTGTRPGMIRNCKKGDFVIQMGPDSSAPGARIVLEAKADKSVDVRGALAELEEARKNRQASAGIFVFATTAAPEGMAPFARYGTDLVVIWDEEDPTSDVFVQAAYSVARALVMRQREDTREARVALCAIEASTRVIEKQAGHLAELRRWAETIVSNGSKISERAQRMQSELEMQVSGLDSQLIALRADTSA